MITIHWDFTDGTELSYIDGLIAKDNFTTNCLDFFNMDIDVDDVIVIKRSGDIISRKNINDHTTKDIRIEHNIQKMLKSNSFNWLKPTV